MLESYSTVCLDTDALVITAGCCGLENAMEWT